MVITTRKFTVNEYHRLIDESFFAEKENIELIRGEIIKMSPKRTPHCVCNSLLWKTMYNLIGDRAEIRVQEPIFIPPNSEPEPDVVIAVNKDDNYLSSHPTPNDILLVVEISDSTLQYDSPKETLREGETKIPLYAEAGINTYWIINLSDRHLEAYTQPLKDAKGKFAYRSKQIVLVDETITIPSFDKLAIDLAKVFPG